MMGIGRNFPITLEVLSPVHIGSGRDELLADYDFVQDTDGIWVIDQQRMLEQVPEEVWTRQEIATRISELLRPEQYQACARYRLNNPTGLGGVDKVIEQIKDAHNQPYIPGSSLKGAMRTVLAWAMLRDGKAKPEPRDLDRDPRRAAEKLMDQLLGPDPNHDLLRALHVVDTESVPAAGGLELAVAAVYSLGASGRLERKGAGYRFFVEVLPVATVLHANLRRDDYVLTGAPAQELGFDRRRDWLLHLIGNSNAFARNLIDRESLFYKQHGQLRLANAYQQLAKRADGLDTSREFLLQIAWGTGWTSKTIGTALDAALLDEIREQYQLGRSGHPIFPKSRRLIERGNAPEMPLGWVKVRLETAS